MVVKDGRQVLLEDWSEVIITNEFAHNDFGIGHVGTYRDVACNVHDHSGPS